MGSSAHPEAIPCNKARTRWLLWIRRLFVILVAYPALNGLLPWVLSLLTSRYGWTEDRPGIVNLLGLLPAIGAAALFVWVLVAKLRPRDPTSALPLLTSGPYAWSRNPLYLAFLGFWLGWTFFYGSVAVLAVFVAFLVLSNTVIVPREERYLEAQFGDAFRRYKAAVPRWL